MSENMNEEKDETTFECEVEKLAALVQHSELTDSNAAASTSAAALQTPKPISGGGQTGEKDKKKRNWRWSRRERKARAATVKELNNSKGSGKTPYTRGPSKKPNTNTTDGPERALRVVVDALLDRFK